MKRQAHHDVTVSGRLWDDTSGWHPFAKSGSGSFPLPGHLVLKDPKSQGLRWLRIPHFSITRHEPTLPAIVIATTRSRCRRSNADSIRARAPSVASPRPQNAGYSR